ncbi:MAG TPA: CPBP family intramembrane metalloprotease [Polyangiaceae bacterium]|nr:CPBP family intramembrane metalloprotease [Polyangiaceae bacterium]
MHKLLHLFWNPRERRPRLLLRLFPLYLAVVVLTIGVHFVNLTFGEVLGPPWQRHMPLFTATGLAAVVPVALACLVLDRRPFRELGLRLSPRWGLDLLFGIALGATLISSIGVAELLLGLATYAPRAEHAPMVPSLLTGLVVFMSVAVVEELLFRGSLLINLAETLESERITRSIAVLASTLVTSAVFGLLHALNPNAGVVSTLNIMLAGVLLAAGLVTTGELAIPVGLHLSWNYFQNLFDMPVSGQSDFAYASVVSRTETGPDWLTGGAFGPEAGVTGLIAIVLGVGAILLYSRLVEGQAGVHGSLLARDRARDAPDADPGRRPADPPAPKALAAVPPPPGTDPVL